jgi:hypothetical protein
MGLAIVCHRSATPPMISPPTRLGFFSSRSRGVHTFLGVMSDQVVAITTYTPTDRKFFRDR